MRSRAYHRGRFGTVGFSTLYDRLMTCVKDSTLFSKGMTISSRFEARKSKSPWPEPGHYGIPRDDGIRTAPPSAAWSKMSEDRGKTDFTRSSVVSVDPGKRPCMAATQRCARIACSTSRQAFDGARHLQGVARRFRSDCGRFAVVCVLARGFSVAVGVAQLSTLWRALWFLRFSSVALGESHRMRRLLDPCRGGKGSEEHMSPRMSRLVLKAYAARGGPLRGRPCAHSPPFPWRGGAQSASRRLYSRARRVSRPGMWTRSSPLLRLALMRRTRLGELRGDR